ncbi:MAG TPA: DNA polymerase [Candidatus Paceibacterota bacterium]
MATNKRTLTSKKKQRLVLLDTHAIIHRAYHALPEFTGPDGSPTGALYGLVSMLIKLISDLEPDYIAACYDLPGPTVRHEAYEAYKGTRAKTDDALSAQITRARAVLEAFSVPLYEREGFEADDLLGTIAHEMKDEVDIIIASGDMDTLQLVDDERVRVYMPGRGFGETILYDEQRVVERLGFAPHLIPDYKGLRGDPSDNIKGIPGIGEKTATILVTSFGPIEAMYKTLTKSEKRFVEAGIKPRIIALLKEHEEDARFSKALATIRLDAPIAFALPANHWHEHVSLQKVLVLLEELGFRSLRERARSVLAKASGIVVAEDEEGGGEEDMPAQAASDPTLLAEAQVMLWLISSEFTNASLDDVLAFTKEHSLEAAHGALEGQLAGLGHVRDVYEHIEKPLIPILRAMEARGVLIDPKALAGLASEYRKELGSFEKKIHKAAGHKFNISSPKQLGDVLFDELALVSPEGGRQKKTATGQRSTRESELEKLRGEHPIIDQILEYRELKKLLSTYIDNLPPLLDHEHRLHTQFVQTGTTTGRMASANPNLQNIPLHSERGRAIRRAFVTPRGFTLVALDYSQIELRLAAILSGDEKLCAIFHAGRDVHREVAAMVFGVAPEKVDREMRRRAKVINFGILYGMGVNALRAQLSSTTAEAHRFLDDYFHTFTMLAQYLEKTKGFARKHGYTETLFGRRRQFPEMKSSLPYVRAQAERMAINAPLQGTQADIIKLAMVKIDDDLCAQGVREDAHLLLQVHDELVYEIKTKQVSTLATRIKAIMEGVMADQETHGVPILAEMKSGPNWGEMQPL